MDLVDFSEPNLDGDFLALKVEREKQNNSDAADSQIINFLKRCSLADPGVQLLKLAREGSAAVKEEQRVRRELFEAVEQEDRTALEALLRDLSSRKKSFVEEDFTNEAGMNILHYALQNNKLLVARHLVSTCNVNDLMQDMEVKVRGISSFKSNLHIITEMGDIELTRLLLNRLDETPLKRRYMERMVLTELEWQRPRHLSCLHLASMKGHTRLVELFKRCGMNVNFTNNKKDTPLLWAVRYNFIDTVRYLISQGADTNQGNDKGSTPLYWAVRYGFSALVEVLVKEGKVDVNQKRKLGFYYPIILASAIGHFEIVRILLENGADPFVLVNNNLTALHVSSAEGHHHIVEYLIEQGHLNVNQADINGNTALLFAVYGAKVRTMKVLVERGADINCKNKVGQGVWDFALSHPNEHFLTCILVLYKQVAMKIDDFSGLISFPRGRSPLHIAASTGNVKKLHSLLNQGVDPHVRDINGNSFFHLAAKENKTQVLEAFIATVSINELNSNNETALHVAARHGHLEATVILLRKFKLDAKNKQGMTPLHVSVTSDKSNHKLVRKIIEHIVKTSSWSLVDAVDDLGNSALHIACKRGYPEIISELSSLSPKVKNKNGDNPFHIAAVNSNTAVFEAMMETFNKPENGVNFNETNAFEESCLHICARKSDSISLITLISNGADLSLQNAQGNTVIHVLIEESVEEKHKTEAMIEEYHNIKDMAALWWSMHRSIQFPNEGSDLYHDMMRRAMLHLTTELRNNDGHDSIHYAIHMKATDFLREILNTPKVYKLNRYSVNLYDVTFLMPGVTRKCKKQSVKDIDDTSNSKRRAYLNSIVLLDDEITAAKMLDVMPINEIVSNYWSNYQWIYVFLLCIHIAYMILFTLFVTPTPFISTSDFSSNFSTSFHTRTLSLQYRNDNTSSFGWFLLWPVLILFFEFYYLAARLYYIVNGYVQYNSKKHTDSSNVLFDCISTAFYLLVTNLGNILTLSFCVIAIAWYVMLNSHVNFNNYLIIVSLVFLSGWTYLINFTKAIEGLHVFTIMLKYIILRDITRFLGLYIIFLLGCGMAFNTLFQIHPDVVNGDLSMSNTFYNAINAMLGLEPLFREDFDQLYTTYGGGLYFIKTIYVLYILASTVILMNLLIAMMTDTYTNIQAREVSTWKVGSLKLALKMEEVFPVIRKAFTTLCMNRDRLTYDFEFERWMMPIPVKRFSRREKEAAEGLHKVTRRIENRVEQLHSMLEELSNNTEMLSREFQKMSSEASDLRTIKRFRNIGQLLSSSKENKI